MYKSYIYLEVRVLLSAVPGVFLFTNSTQRASDILTAKENFIEKTFIKEKFDKVQILPSVLRKASAFVTATGGTLLKASSLQKLTAFIPQPPDDREYTGSSVKIATGGSIDIVFHQKAKRIALEEIRIEEDCGHLTRSGNTKPHMDWTYAGCPVLRIRTANDLEVGEEAELFLQELYTIMSYLKLPLGELGENSLRCNAYTALAEYPQKPSYIVKLRNLNSFNFVRKAINSDISRQEDVLTSGGTVQSESRLWIAEKNTTESWQKRTSGGQFITEEPPIMVNVALDSGPQSVGELPAERRARLRRLYGLSRLRAEFICAQKERADYFEKAIEYNAPPLLTARWMAGELTKLINAGKQTLQSCSLTPEYFALIMNMMHDGRIHSGMAKIIMQEVFKTGQEPLEVIKRKSLTLLSSKEEIEPFVDRVLQKNQGSVESLRGGDMAPLEYLTGCVLKESENKASPQVAKALIKEKLNISVVYVLTMEKAVQSIKTPKSPVQIVPVCDCAESEAELKDYASLIAEIALRIQSNIANGIVVLTGMETIQYTAALLFWLFASSEVPIVVTSEEENLDFAIETAEKAKRGAYLSFKKKLYSPLNLKFSNRKDAAFENLMQESPIFYYEGGLSGQFLTVDSPDAAVMKGILNEAAAKLTVIHLYPGLPIYRIESLLDSSCGIKHIILELYSSGKCNMTGSDYSLNHLLLKGRKLGISFYCTSQIEHSVEDQKDSSLLRFGAIPMGHLTTESVIALYFAASLLSDSEEELTSLMENALDSL